jgi:hypothetical protein
MRRAGHVTRTGVKNAYTVLVGRHLENLGIYGTIIIKLIFKKWDGGMDWIDLAYDRVKWRALVNVVMNLRVP